MIGKVGGLAHHNRTLLSNLFSLSVLQGANYLLPLITLPYLARVLGAERFGLIAFAQAFILYFIILTDYGFNLSATKEISVHRDDARKIAEVFWSVLLVKFVLTLLSFGVLLGIVFGVAHFRSEWEVYVLAFGMVIGRVLYPLWLFQGLERMKYIVLVNLVAKLFFTALIFIVVKQASDYLYVPLINSGGFIVAAVLGLYVALRHCGVALHLPTASSVWSHLKASTQFFLARLSASLYTSSSVVFLGLLGGDATVGYYSAAEKVFLAFQGIYEPVVVSIYPYMSKYRNMGVYRAVFKVSVLFNSLCCVLLFVFSGPLVSLLFGEDFQTSSLILKVFSAALLLVVPSTLLGYPFLAALGFAPCANNSVIAGSLFHLMALVSVCLLVGLNAPLAAGLSVATEAIILTMRAYWVRKHGLWSGGYGQALAGSTCSAVITEGGRQAW